MKENRRADQVLGEVPEEGNRPGRNQQEQHVSSRHALVWRLQADYLSSTFWNTQLGVWVVVKMRLSVGILGADKRGGLSLQFHSERGLLFPCLPS